MKVTPRTEKEISEMNMIPDGEYMYCVMNAEEQVSKGGNDMVKLSLNIFSETGDIIARLFDYLVEIDSMAYKIRHFADSAGLLEQYETGDLPAADMIGAQGMCKIGNKPAQGSYPAGNIVKDYVKKNDAASVASDVKKAAASPKKKPAEDDDMDMAIPF